MLNSTKLFLIIVNLVLIQQIYSSQESTKSNQIIEQLIIAGSASTAKNASKERANQELICFIQKTDFTLKDEECIEELIDCEGADINIQERLTGKTILIAATIANKSRLVEFLLKNQADQKLLDIKNNDAYNYALMSDNAKEAKIILSFLKKYEPIDVNQQLMLELEKEKLNAQKIRELIEIHGANVNTKSYYTSTALLEAASIADVELVQFLLDHKANTNFVSSEGGNVLHYLLSAQRDKANQIETILSLLLKVNPNLIKSEDKGGNTPLMIAVAEMQSIKIIEILIKSCPELINSANDSFRSDGKWNGKCTALHMAALEGNFEAVKLLLANNADKNIKNYNGETPLDFARSQCKFIIQCYHEAGGSLNGSAKEALANLSKVRDLLNDEKFDYSQFISN